jgi:hypothetical protein
MTDICDDFNEFLDSIDKGDRKITILVTSGRNGSNLLQSLFDSHSSILMMPTLFWFYADWKRFFGVKKQISLDEAIDFLRSSSYSRDFYNVGLGDNRDESIFIDRLHIEKAIIGLSGPDRSLSRRELLIMLHYAYGMQKYKVLDDKKLIFFHHHFPFSSLLEDYVNSNTTVRLPVIDELSDLMDDFPMAGILHSVRNPYSAYLSGLAADYETGKPLNIRQHFFQTLGILSGADLAIKRLYSTANADSIGYWVVRYEDLHCMPEDVLKNLSTALGIEYENILLKSTFDGKLWWGNNPARPINGTSRDFIKAVSVGNLSRSVTNGLWDCLDKIALDLDYEVIERPFNRFERFCHQSFFLSKIFYGWLASFFKVISAHDKVSFSFPNIKFLVFYPSYWSQMISLYIGK